MKNPTEPTIKTLWKRHYTRYQFARYTDGWHIIDNFSMVCLGKEEPNVLHIAPSKEEAIAWCEKHSKVTTMEQHHQSAIDRAIAYLEKNGYVVTQK